MQFPIDDWQFWIAAALVLASMLYVLRSVASVGEGATCHCGKPLQPQESPESKRVVLSISVGRSADGDQDPSSD